MARHMVMTTAQQRPLTILPTTMDGQPVRLEGTPTFLVQSGDCTVVPLEDERHVMLVAGEKIGTCEILMEANVDVGQGFHHAHELLVIQVQGEDAAHIGLDIGEAELNPRAVAALKTTQETEASVVSERLARRRVPVA